MKVYQNSNNNNNNNTNNQQLYDVRDQICLNLSCKNLDPLFCEATTGLQKGGGSNCHEACARSKLTCSVKNWEKMISELGKKTKSDETKNPTPAVQIYIEMRQIQKQLSMIISSQISELSNRFPLACAKARTIFYSLQEDRDSNFSLRNFLHFSPENSSLEFKESVQEFPAVRLTQYVETFDEKIQDSFFEFSSKIKTILETIPTSQSLQEEQNKPPPPPPKPSNQPFPQIKQEEPIIIQQDIQPESELESIQYLPVNEDNDDADDYNDDADYDEEEEESYQNESSSELDDFSHSRSPPRPQKKSSKNINDNYLKQPIAASHYYNNVQKTSFPDNSDSSEQQQQQQKQQQQQLLPISNKIMNKVNEKEAYRTERQKNQNISEHQMSSDKNETSFNNVKLNVTPLLKGAQKLPEALLPNSDATAPAKPALNNHFTPLSMALKLSNSHQAFPLSKETTNLKEPLRMDQKQQQQPLKFESQIFQPTQKQQMQLHQQQQQHYQQQQQQQQQQFFSSQFKKPFGYQSQVDYPMEMPSLHHRPIMYPRHAKPFDFSQPISDLSEKPPNHDNVFGAPPIPMFSYFMPPQFPIHDRGQEKEKPKERKPRKFSDKKKQEILGLALEIGFEKAAQEFHCKRSTILAWIDEHNQNKNTSKQDQPTQNNKTNINSNSIPFPPQQKATKSSENQAENLKTLIEGKKQREIFSPSSSQSSFKVQQEQESEVKQECEFDYTQPSYIKPSNEPAKNVDDSFVSTQKMADHF